METENTNTDWFNTPIGTKEQQKLTPKKVKVVGKKLEMQNYQGKDIGHKLTFLCKHPDKTDVIEISQTQFLADKKIKTSGLWYKLDEDMKISKKCALAITMQFHGCNSIAEFEGKEIDTVADEKGYLCVKAY